MYDIAIIGGGAAGLAAAITAGACNVKRIVVLESSQRIGRKILATGNGRCNLSHQSISPSDYRGSVPAEKVLSDFGDAVDFFASLGLHIRTDDQGRMYPYTMAASSVLDVLRSACMQYSVEEICSQRVRALEKCKNQWKILTDTDEFFASAVIFAAGGHAAGKLGTDGSAWQILRNLGVTITPPRPILCPVLSDERILKSLKGIRAKASVSLYHKETLIATETGEVQFTQNALSGICIFNLAEWIPATSQNEYSVHLDLIPELSQKETVSMLHQFADARYGADCLMWLTGFVQKPIALHILKQAGIRTDRNCTSLTGKQMSDISKLLHDNIFPVLGLASFEQAQATAGGISASELDDTLQLKHHPGLYAAGEVLDIHSICGGYHLHWAWSSGVYAARNAAAGLR